MHWSGYTSGYQGKRIDNTSTRDEPYRFTVGAHQVGTAACACLPSIGFQSEAGWAQRRHVTVVAIAMSMLTTNLA